MTTIAHLDAPTRRSLVERLKRIEGQARGIAEMIEDERDCLEIVQQLAAIRAAIDSLSVELLQAMVEQCWSRNAVANSPALTRALRMVLRSSR